MVKSVLDSCSLHLGLAFNFKADWKFLDMAEN